MWLCSSTNRSPPPPRGLSYQSQSAILQFLSFQKRRALCRRVTSIRSLERRLPYSFLIFQASRMDEPALVFVDGVIVFEFSVDSEGVVSVVRRSSVLCGGILEKWRRRHERMETALTRWNMISTCVKYFLDRPGTRIFYFALQKCPETLQNFHPIVVQKMILNLDNYRCDWFKSLVPHPQLVLWLSIRDDGVGILKDPLVKVSLEVNICEVGGLYEYGVLRFQRKRFTRHCKNFLANPFETSCKQFFLDDLTYHYQLFLFRHLARRFDGYLDIEKRQATFYRDNYLVSVFARPYRRNGKQAYYFAIERWDWNEKTSTWQWKSEFSWARQVWCRVLSWFGALWSKLWFVRDDTRSILPLDTLGRYAAFD